MFGLLPTQPKTVTFEELQEDIEEAWDLEELVDRSVQIRYCVATSGAKTYGEFR